MTNASASLTQGVSYGNSGFLTPQAPTSPLPPEQDEAWRPLTDLWPATLWTNREASPYWREHLSPSMGLPGLAGPQLSLPMSAKCEFGRSQGRRQGI